jgi:biopolymer transport protein ExbB
MKTTYRCILVALCAVLQVYGAPDRRVAAKEQELSVLKTYLEAARDSLQKEISSRWRTRQRYVEQRELDKEEIVRYRDAQERLQSDVARSKEEVFVKERILEDERKQLAQKQDEWNLVYTTLAEVLQKEGDAVMDGFPLDREVRRRELELIRRDLIAPSAGARVLSKYIDFRVGFFRRGASIIISKESIIPDEGETVVMTVVRFGSVFGYGFVPGTGYYFIRQTGALGPDRYKIEKITAPLLEEAFNTVMPQWVAEGRVSGRVPVDVLQNNQTELLISGKKTTAKTALSEYMRKGGPVMIPLALILLWGVVLIIWKLILFGRKMTVNTSLSHTVMDYLSKNEPAKAHEYASKHRGVVAKIVQTCLEHSKWNRQSAEKAVREILVEEVPLLNKHLTTIAVIAGAAPLLGLLGTVSGMISLFEVITNYGTGDPKLMAGGISEALVTTEAGLIVAIPILLTHNFLRNRSVDIQAQMEKHAIHILNRLWPEAK